MTISRRTLLAAALTSVAVRPARSSQVDGEMPAAPIRTGAVCLAVGNLALMTAYYREALGLLLIEGDGRRSIMGAGGVPLLVLESAPGAQPAASGAAGLYHTAFLMPRREDLGSWVVHAARTRIPISGASDHSVSEAIYLDDPEGNGIEVYADRPSSTWSWFGNTVAMGSTELDIDALYGLGSEQSAWYSAAPAGMRVGHVHLKVGDVDAAMEFYGRLGLVETRKRDGAGFMASGRYHHHLGLNTWQSAGAGRRAADALGLRWITFHYADAEVLASTRRSLMEKAVATQTRDGLFLIDDPWGTQVRLST